MKKIKDLSKNNPKLVNIVAFFTIFVIVGLTFGFSAFQNIGTIKDVGAMLESKKI